MDYESLKNVYVLDATTGLVLFEKVYRWPDNATSSNIGSLIQSFYQFAREVEGGEIVSVSFEGNPFLSPTSSSNANSRDGRFTKGLGAVMDGTLDTMQMLCLQSEMIVVSVFFDTHGQLVTSSATKQKYEQFMRALRERFEAEYRTILETLRQELLTNYSRGGGQGQDIELDAEEGLRIREAFLAFGNVLDDLLSPNPTNPIINTAAGSTESQSQSSSLATVAGSQQSQNHNQSQINAIEQVSSVFAAATSISNNDTSTTTNATAAVIVKDDDEEVVVATADVQVEVP